MAFSSHNVCMLNLSSARSVCYLDQCMLSRCMLFWCVLCVWASFSDCLRFLLYRLSFRSACPTLRLLWSICCPATRNSYNNIICYSRIDTFTQITKHLKINKMQSIYFWVELVAFKWFISVDNITFTHLHRMMNICTTKNTRGHWQRKLWIFQLLINLDGLAHIENKHEGPI